MDGQGTTWRRNIAENFNRLSRAHQRYRRQTTDGPSMTNSERELEFTFAKMRSIVRCTPKCTLTLRTSPRKWRTTKPLSANRGSQCYYRWRKHLKSVSLGRTFLFLAILFSLTSFLSLLLSPAPSTPLSSSPRVFGFVLWMPVFSNLYSPIVIVGNKHMHGENFRKWK